MMKTVLFYGDSNTWGFDPETGGRYPYEKRWTTVCSKHLGEEFQCIPCGMNGRTTVFDDPLKGCRNGIDGLDYELQTHKPIDIFVLMLGTNDLKYTDAKGSAAGMKQLIQKLISVNQRFSLSSPVFPKEARILLVSPVHLNQNISESGTCDARSESEKLAALYEKLAQDFRMEFMDASAVADASGHDGIHLGETGHRNIGLAIAEKIRQNYENEMEPFETQVFQ